MPKPIHETITEELEKLFDPLIQAADDPLHRKALLTALDLDLTDQEIADLAAAFSTVEGTITSGLQAIQDPPESLGELHGLLEEVAELVETVDAIESAVDGVVSEGADGLAADLVDYLVLSYLEREYPNVFFGAVALALVDLPDLEAEENADVEPSMLLYQAARHSELDFQQLSGLFSEPVAALKASYLPEGEQVSPELAREVESRLFVVLQQLFGSLGFQVSYGMVPQAATDDSSDDPPSDPFSDVEGLSVPSRILTVSRTLAGQQLAAHLAVAISEDRLALLVAPTGSFGLEETLGRWRISTSLSADFEVVVLDADGIAGSKSADGSAVDSIEGSLAVDKLPPKDAENAFAVGAEGGTRLEIGSFGVEGTVDVSDGNTDYGAGIRAGDSSFVISPGEGDGFLKKVLPEDGVETEFDLGLGWSSGKGVYVEGSASLESTIPVHFSIGEVLTVDAVHLGMTPGEDGGIPVGLSTTATTKLGPLSGTVERIGASVDLTFPDDGKGNLGPVDAAIGFKPPKGVGLSIDAGGVTGGGYLFFDAENERYAGAVQLQVGDLSLSAVGLVTTELPDGSDGFSLLVIVAGEFPPVQLGFGFTLNGVGGLLGVNRSTRIEVLRQGVRDGGMNAVLFPKNPVANAQRIVSDLREIFPPTRGQHVFGPMVKGGWGTPTMITASLGVVLELPDPVRIIILGRLRTVLPDEDAAIVKIQMNVLGSINVTEGKAGVDASLYDSRVVTFPVSGDMAMRSSWGDESRFLLSVGGFNPRYEPPSKFPELDRVSIDIVEGDNPTLRASGYFAVTSNTVQVGAALDLHASAGGFGVDGHLGFDSLFRFDPFEFYLDVAAHLTFSTPLGDVGISLDGTLSGPSPWHIWGTVSLDVGFVSVDVSVDVSIGDDQSGSQLPPAEVMPEVRSALGDERNWSAQVPEGGESLVSLRETDAEDRVLAHPLGQLQVRQQVVPLGVAIEKFGSKAPADFAEFGIHEVTVNGEPIDQGGRRGDELREQFAPAQFFEMSQDEKLSRPSFERYGAGRTLTDDGIAFGGRDDDSLSRVRTLTFECSYVDRTRDTYRATLGVGNVRVDVAAALAEVSASATGDARNTGSETFAVDGASSTISVDDERYVVADGNTMQRKQDVTGVPTGGTTYAEAEQAKDEYVAANPGWDGRLQVVATHEVDAEGQEGAA